MDALENCYTRMKKTPLKRMSQKREADYKAYLKERDEFLAKNKFCEMLGIGCSIKSQDLHHMKGRTGKLLRDKMWWFPICSRCHRWIHDNMKEARRRGLVLWK